jgi:hypothetical protein
LESLKGKDGSEDLDEDGRTILKWLFGEQVWRVLNGFVWLRAGTGDRLL